MNDSNQNAIEARGVVKSYGATRALNGIDLNVARGEFVALLGPNGAGKSTLFQLLSGLFVQDEGSISVCGFDTSRESTAALARTGVVFQQPTIDLDLTVQANLKFHARLHGMPRNQRDPRIAQELARVDLSDQRGTPTRKLSGGNRRRVELARALLHSPQLLLMDEATVGLDPESRQLLLQHVRELCQSDAMAVLWATHLVDEAEDADRIYVLHGGNVVAQGTPAEIKEEMAAETLLDAFLQLTSKTTA